MTHHRTTVRDALQAARQTGLDRLDAQVLLLHCLGREHHDRAWLIAHDSDTLPTEAAERFTALCQRRLTGEPVAYLVGQREFHGLTLQVDARVLDPRPDTETLVDWALDVLAGQTAPTVLDLGTGSGAIALALQHRRPDAQVWAVDASADALAVAQGNATRLGLPVRFRLGHWLRGWPTGTTDTPPARFDMIVSNPPYIRADDPHLAALTHEPMQALASGADGLDDIREIVVQARAHLRPGGHLLLEHGWDQGADVAHLLNMSGYRQIAHRQDLAGHVRCTGAAWPGQPTPF
ncbi:peptide chain release factor N(5)-glutamine methyltransferase [Hydrogenophaga aquatica]